MVTASHNPPQYNGYKVYWEDGAQITAPKDKQIITEVQAITDFAQVKTMSEEDAKAAGLYEVIGEEIDDRYMEALKKLVLRPEAIKEQADKLKKSALVCNCGLPDERVYPHLSLERPQEQAGYFATVLVKE